MSWKEVYFQIAYQLILLFKYKHWFFHPSSSHPLVPPPKNPHSCQKRRTPVTFVALDSFVKMKTWVFQPPLPPPLRPSLVPPPKEPTRLSEEAWHLVTLYLAILIGRNNLYITKKWNRYFQLICYDDEDVPLSTVVKWPIGKSSVDFYQDQWVYMNHLNCPWLPVKEPVAVLL